MLKRTHATSVLSVASCTSLLLLATLPARAQSVEVRNEDAHGVVGPVLSMPVSSSPLNAASVRPRPVSPANLFAKTTFTDDAALQADAATPNLATPGLSILGLGTGFPNFRVQYAPPDTNAAVGTTQLVEVVNLSFAIFDKATGAIEKGPVALNTLFTGIDASCGNGSNLSDPVILFDQLAGRWVFEFFTVNSPYKYCFAVSTSSDATGTYNAYTFTETAGLPDYTKTAIWPDAYYAVARLFRNGSSYIGPKACAVNRIAMVQGAASTMQCFQVTNSSLDGMLPANLDGLVRPPTGSPEFFLVPNGSDALLLYKFQVDFTTPANSTFTGPTSITVAAYNEASRDVPQLGTTQLLDSLGFALMNRLVYRNFSYARKPHESLVVTHNINAGSGTTYRVAPRWYEVRNPNGTPTLYQQGTFSPDTTYRWAGSIAFDRVGDLLLGYSASSSTIHPAIRYTGRVPTDPLGTMETEAVSLQGNGSQTAGLNRWGDYSSMVIDPVDGCTFWYAQEYIPVNGSFNWSTSLASFRFSTCK